MIHFFFRLIHYAGPPCSMCYHHQATELPALQSIVCVTVTMCVREMPLTLQSNTPVEGHKLANY